MNFYIKCLIGSLFFIWMLLGGVSNVYADTGLFGKKGYKPSGVLHYSRADEKRLHFGFSVGLGVYDSRIHNTDYAGEAFSYRAEQTQFSTAFRMGIITEVNISDHFSVRTIPGLYFGDRMINYFEVYHDGYPTQTNLKSIYADFPLYLKYRGIRMGNYNLYVIAGPSYRFDLTPHTELEPHNDILIRTKVDDFSFDVGGGVDCYLKYFRMGIELRVSIGMPDIMEHEVDTNFPNLNEYTDAIESFKTTIVTLSLNFE